VVELVPVDDEEGGMPHSSRLCPYVTVSISPKLSPGIESKAVLTFSQHQTLPPNSCHAQ
jgi:hypothetical protein